MTVGRSLPPPGLIDKAISLVKGFNPATQTGDSYADDVLGGSCDKRDQKAATSDSIFLKQVTSEAEYMSVACAHIKPHPCLQVVV